MSPLNGSDDLHKAVLSAFERVAAVMSRMNTALRAMSDSVLEQGARREREHETVRTKLEEIRREILSLNHDVEEARKDITDPRLKIPDKAESSGTGKSLAIDARRIILPTPWVGWLLKLAVPAIGGGALMRLLQWMTIGH